MPSEFESSVSLQGMSLEIQMGSRELTNRGAERWSKWAMEAVPKFLERHGIAKSDRTSHIIAREVNFTNNKIGDNGLHFILKALHYLNIGARVMRFSGNSLGRAAASVLMDWLALTPSATNELHLSHNWIPKEGAYDILNSIAVNLHYPATSGSRRIPLLLGLEMNLITEGLDGAAFCRICENSMGLIREKVTRQKLGIDVSKEAPMLCDCSDSSRCQPLRCVCGRSGQSSLVQLLDLHKQRDGRTRPPAQALEWQTSLPKREEAARWRMLAPSRPSRPEDDAGAAAAALALRRFGVNVPQEGMASMSQASPPSVRARQDRGHATPVSLAVTPKASGFRGRHKELPAASAARAMAQSEANLNRAKTLAVLAPPQGFEVIPSSPPPKCPPQAQPSLKPPKAKAAEVKRPPVGFVPHVALDLKSPPPKAKARPPPEHFIRDFKVEPSGEHRAREVKAPPASLVKTPDGMLPRAMQEVPKKMPLTRVGPTVAPESAVGLMSRGLGLRSAKQAPTDFSQEIPAQQIQNGNSSNHREDRRQAKGQSQEETPFRPKILERPQRAQGPGPSNGLPQRPASPFLPAANGLDPKAPEFIPIEPVRARSEEREDPLPVKNSTSIRGRNDRSCSPPPRHGNFQNVSIRGRNDCSFSPPPRRGNFQNVSIRGRNDRSFSPPRRAATFGLPNLLGQPQTAMSSAGDDDSESAEDDLGVSSASGANIMEDSKEVSEEEELLPQQLLGTGWDA